MGLGAYIVVGTAPFPDQLLAVGSGDHQFDFSATTGGGDSFTATPPFPFAWDFDRATGILTVHTNQAIPPWTGIVSRILGAETFDTESFTISVQNAATFIGPNFVDLTSYVGDVVTLNIAGLFLGANSFRLAAGTLPSGLSLNATTGMLTGTLTTAQTRTGLQFVGDGVIGSPATNTFNWTITARLSPPVFSGKIANQSIVLGSAITAVNAAANFTGATNGYAISQAVAGLSFNNTTGALSGTPTAASTYALSVTGYNPDGQAYSNQFLILVTSVSPVFSGTPGSQNVQLGQPIAPVPWANFFSGGSTFATASTLPVGVTLDPNTGQLSGAPQNDPANIGTYVINVTATNPSGSTLSTSPATINVTAAVITEKRQDFQMLLA